MRMRMKHHTRGSIQLKEDRDFNMRRRTRVMERSLCNVGLAARIITGEIFNCIRVAYLGYTVLKRHKQLGMLERVFLRFM